MNLSIFGNSSLREVNVVVSEAKFLRRRINYRDIEMSASRVSRTLLHRGALFLPVRTTRGKWLVLPQPLYRLYQCSIICSTMFHRNLYADGELAKFSERSEEHYESWKFVVTITNLSEYPSTYNEIFHYELLLLFDGMIN